MDHSAVPESAVRPQQSSVAETYCDDRLVCRRRHKRRGFGEDTSNPRPPDGNHGVGGPGGDFSRLVILPVLSSAFS